MPERPWGNALSGARPRLGQDHLPERTAEVSPTAAPVK
jgi:hypothetical protein